MKEHWGGGAGIFCTTQDRKPSQAIYIKFFYLFRHRISGTLVYIQCLDITEVLHNSQDKMFHLFISQ